MDILPNHFRQAWIPKPLLILLVYYHRKPHAFKAQAKELGQVVEHEAAQLP